MILLDTHVVLWLLARAELSADLRLSTKAHDLIAESRRTGSGVSVSDFTLWEVAMLASRGRIMLPETLGDLLRRIGEQFSLVRLDGRIAERSQEFSSAYPKDPADRIIGATAIVHRMTLVTADRKILSSGEVPCVW